jgi:putative resolvase
MRYLSHEVEPVCQTTGNQLQYGAALVAPGRDLWLSGPSGTIIVKAEEKPQPREERVAIYACDCSAEHRENLERQVERLTQYCTTRGYQVAQEVKEVTSGVNDSHPKRLALLKDNQTIRIVFDHNDRFTRFGFRFLETLLELQDRTIEVVNVAENDKEDLIADLGAIVYSFTARLSGQRRAKRKTERIVQELREPGKGGPNEAR